MNREDQASWVVASSTSPAAQRWRKVCDEQRASGMTVSAFCRLKSIPASSLFAWRRKLADRGESPAASVIEPKASPRRRKFIEVKAAPADTRPSAIELRLKGDRRLLVRRGFDPEALAGVIRVLEGMA
jgi:transposase-like protein